MVSAQDSASQPAAQRRTVYRPVLLAIFFIAAVPSFVGAIWSYLGSKNVLNRVASQQLLTTVSSYATQSDRAIERLATSCRELYNNLTLRELLTQLDRSVVEKAPAAQRQELNQRIKFQLTNLLNQYPELVYYPTGIYHRQHPRAVLSWDQAAEASEQALLDRLFRRDPTPLDGELRWNLYNRQDPLTGQPYALFVMGLDGDSLRTSQLFHFAIIRLEKLLPFLSPGALAENHSLSVLARIPVTPAGDVHLLHHAGDYTLPLTDTRLLELVRSSERLSGIETLGADAHASRIVGYHYLSSLRQRQKTEQGGAGAALEADWLLCLSGDTEEALGVLGYVYWQAWLGGGVLVFITWLGGALLARRFVRPLLQLTQMAEHIAQGDFRSRVPVGRRDEIGRLAAAFNEMTEHLELSYQDLRHSLEELRAHSAQLQLLQEIANAVNTQLSLDKIFAVITRDIRKLIPYDLASISFLDPDGRRLTVRMTTPETTEPLFQPGAKVRVADTNRGWVVTHQKPLIRLLGEAEIADGPPEDDPPPAGLEDSAWANLGMQSIIILPLISASGAIGTFGIGTRTRRAYGRNERDILRRMANVLAIAIDHSRLLERAQASTEELEREIDARKRDLERAQSKLIQTEKMAATGRLAGSLAHEINNPLGIISNYLKIATQQAEAAPGGGDFNLEHLLIVQEEIGRIARIVKGMMGFYRPSHGQHQPTNLQETMDQILALLERDWEKKGLRVALHYIDDLPLTSVSPDLIRQVFMNLLRNAEDAMEGGGWVEVFFAVEPITAERPPDAPPEHEPRQLRIRITDTGCGIPNEAMLRIFDPFFTTKKDEKGTGLGLSVTYSILQSLGGSIDIKSRPRPELRGGVDMDAEAPPAPSTTITLIVPVIEDQGPPPAPPSRESLLLG